MSYLLDTNVVSEVMKSPESSVSSWVADHESVCFLSSVTVGEIERGIELLAPGRKKHRLQESFHEILSVLEERVLSFDLSVARRWAVMAAMARRSGHNLPILDSMIEATALHWKLIVATRNTSDFVQVQTLNPWLIQS